MTTNLLLKKVTLFIFLLLWAALWKASVLTASETILTQGQTVYVPAYSHIYAGNKERPFLLSVTLSIRNTDPRHSITVTRANYYDSGGKLLVNYVKTPVALAPMASTRYIVKESDKARGSGANFVVTWKAEGNVNPPVIESIMIGTQAQQGISFTSRGQVIE